MLSEKACVLFYGLHAKKFMLHLQSALVALAAPSFWAQGMQGTSFLGENVDSAPILRSEGVLRPL